MMNHMKKIIYLSLFMFLNVKGNGNLEKECGIQYNINRIIDGTVTDLREFPWMALLIYQTEKGPGLACGGVLINQKFILTAAHCVTDESVTKIGKLIVVRLGEHDTRTDPDCDGNLVDEDCAESHVDIYVESTFSHPNYTTKGSNRYNDIALVKLKTAITYSKDLQPICLPTVSSELSWTNSGSELHICGWGQTETREVGSFVKLKAKVPVINQEECNMPYARKGITIGDLQVCAGGGTTDTCKGDSGGPLMYEDNANGNDPRWYAVGVTSFGAIPCASKDVPAVYTKITPYLQWINSIINL